MATNTHFVPTDYSALAISDEEKALVRRFAVQYADCRRFFLQYRKPRLDRSYQLYIGDNRQRAREIQDWSSNFFVPAVQATVETLKPRILDARPDLGVLARDEDSREKVPLVNARLQYDWEKAQADEQLEDLVSSSLIYGDGCGQVSWKRDIRTMSFLDPKKVKAKMKSNKPLDQSDFIKKDQVFYDGPSWNWVDNYDLWYDWHNVSRESKQYWMKRRLMTEEEIQRSYPGADPVRLRIAFKRRGGDVTNYASIRWETKKSHYGLSRFSERYAMGWGGDRGVYTATDDADYTMHEVIEWNRPFGDTHAVMVNNIPVLDGGFLPFLYDFKETPFFTVPFLRIPGEFEGIGLPLLMESPQLLLNTIKNQRIDAATLNIHKTWIVNPLANVNKKDLVVRPYGIIYTNDPNSVREVQVSDVKQSAYEEEKLLKQDLQHISGVDDASMGVGSNANATEIRHLRESTLERVRLFVNHLSSGLNFVMRTWLSMHRQFQSGTVKARMVDDSGKEMFIQISPDDLKGEFEYKSAVIPSIAGMNDVERKMAMDLFQLLQSVPGVDMRKLVSKTVSHWQMGLNDIMSDQDQPQQPMMPGQEQGQELPPGMEAQVNPDLQAMAAESQAPAPSGVSPDVINALLASAGHQPGLGASPYAELSSPVDLLSGGQMPPTAPDTTKAPASKALAGRLNRAGGTSKSASSRVNTSIPTGSSDTQANILRQAVNTHR